ncbi:ABC transporter ATP-binding protein [Lactobacillus sp. CBA3606]|uniref:ATP-binding cassette domain-containing protein n=1 Tax=Lactobacillus sp. CBA3606 TaxID=2099789 RepID=UPI000CFAD3EA|nr:ATP-binding cassette domain-containing protein [Lactobacillus sp. CBA3606]AVK63502.1 ABC transporter ATP-binding protein [Lactobacillus sp. CBA3606]
MTLPLIKLTKVSKKYKHNFALKNINLEIKHPGVYGFSGPNGSGKSMTFKTILGFIRPTTGTVLVNGAIIRKDTLFANNVGFSMSEYGVLPSKSGPANLELLCILAKYPVSEIPVLLKYVGLDPTDNRKVSAYSLGMQQRLSIATALIGNQEIIILDEPTNALDEDGQHFLQALIRDLRQKGKTILVSSHDASFLRSVSDYIYFLNEGCITREEAIS